MPIEQLSDQRRMTRDFKVRLGTRIVKATKATAGADEARGPGEAYPKEQDYFVLEEAPDDVKKIYKDKPRSLRIMLGFEWDQQSPQGDDLVFSLYNRAYGASRGLKCRGTGRSSEFFGTARTNDEAWALRIEKATGYAPEPYKSPGGETYYTIRCLGRDCPKFLHKVRVPDPTNPAREIDALAPGHDRDASCNDVAILRCFLLHPSIDAKDPDYCRSLGVMELATGSINSIIDLQSGFDLLKPFTAGRTAGIPMTLVRKPTVTYRPVKQTHFTCAIHFDHREVQRWAAVPVSEVFLSEAQRATLKQLSDQPLGLTVDSVRDLIPRGLPEAIGNGSATPSFENTEPGVGSVLLPDPAGDVSEPPVAPQADWADTPRLVAAQIDQLKQAAGGPVDALQPYDKFKNPWRAESLERLRGAVLAMRSEFGIEPLALSDLRTAHFAWLMQRLKSLPPLD